MSAIIDSSLTRYFEGTISDPVVGSGVSDNKILTLGAWAKTSTLTVLQTIYSLSKTTTPARYARIWHRGTEANDPWSGQLVQSGGTTNRDAGNYIDGNWAHLLFEIDFTALTVRTALNGVWSSTTAISTGNLSGINRVNIGAVYSAGAITQIFTGKVAGTFAVLGSLSSQNVTDLQTQWPDQVSGLSPFQANRLESDGSATHGAAVSAVNSATFDAADNPIASATGFGRLILGHRNHLVTT